MRKQLIPLIITLLFFMGNNCFAQTFGGGNGTAGNPWKIYNVNDLNTIATYVNNNWDNFSGDYFIMMNDITAGNFTPIGTSRNRSFRGNFNGQGNIISNFNPSGGITYLGIFGYIRNAKIENIGIGSGCNINSANNGYTGGLIGYAETSEINNCYSSANMSGNTNCRLGGLIGNADDCDINNCYYSGGNINYSGSNGYYGGLIGYIDGTSNISNSYSAPSNFPNQPSRTGPLYGRCITNCFINSYYLSGWNTQTYGTSKTSIQMQDLQFAILLNVSCQNNNWKHDNIPTLVNGGFPILYWQVGGSTLPPCFDGSGTEVDPFRIRYVKDLVMLSNNVAGGSTYSGQYLLVENNISFTTNPSRDSSQYFNPIGNSTNRFSGNFNGGGHVISNLTINLGTYVGLFGYISGATIDSLGIENFTYTSNRLGGGLVAYAYNSTINYSYSIGSLTSTGNNSTTEYPELGGLIGHLDKSSLNNCYARARIFDQTGNTRSSFGGLVAHVQPENGNYNYISYINNSYAASYPIPRVGDCGSLLGYVRNTYNFSETNSYHYDLSGMIRDYGGVAKDSSEMKSGCFVVSLNGSQPSIAWFKAKRQVNQGYPVLSWQKLSDNITPAGFEGNCLGVTYAGGTQTTQYKIRYVKDLIYISNMVANDTTYSSKFFQMLNDINFNNGVIDSSSLYKPIGDFSNNKPFSGNFNGLRNAIANYSFSDTTKNNIGFFGYTNLATIQRLGISNINISAKDTVGGLVANGESTKIGGCFVYGFIKGKNSVGGLVGIGTGATSAIDTSFTNTTIDAQTNVGGLVGNHNGGAINNSYSNSEIYSSTNANNYVGGIIGLAAATPTLNKVYSACKIIRNGTNTNFGKIIGNNIGNNTNCYSRDSVFVNYGNSSTTGYNGNPKTNTELRDPSFVSILNGSNSYWKPDYNILDYPAFPDSINDGYPILKYQLQAVKPSSSGAWPNTTASQVVIIQNGVQIKIDTTNNPMCAYVKIENGGELNNTTNINVFGEYNRELYVGKWNLIGLSTYNRILSCLYNYTDSISFKTFVKRFNYTSNNWSTTTTQDINTQFNFGEGILVMPNYSLDARLIIKSRIVAKGVLFNDTTLSYTFNNTSTATNKFVSLANNYPASLDTALLINNNSSLIQGRLIYVYDADSGKWNNNLSSNVRVTSLKPCEGFFMAPSSASGIFNFKKSQIKNTSGAKNLIKSDLIYVQAIADSNVRESFLEFNEEADNGFDFEDGLMLFGNNYNSVEPFFTIPTPEINDSTTQLIKDAFSSLPYTTELDLRSQKTNEVSLDFSNIPSNIHVYLLDSLLNKAQYINEQPNYELQVNEGDNAKRLYVLFSYYKEDINEFFKPEVAQEIKIWNYNNNLNIEGRDLIRYELFDIMGNKLLVEDILDDKFKTQLDLVSGIYIVRAFSSSSSKAQKISISSK